MKKEDQSKKKEEVRRKKIKAHQLTLHHSQVLRDNSCEIRTFIKLYTFYKQTAPKSLAFPWLSLFVLVWFVFWLGGVSVSFWFCSGLGWGSAGLGLLLFWAVFCVLALCCLG